ncbi:hypothetical protein A2U01_0104592, partial [Trifolium medium]|nr:hypothetical protein [Trifolium medium]
GEVLLSPGAVLEHRQARYWRGCR